LVEQLTAEYRISNRRIMKDGMLRSIFFLISTEFLPSTFDIQYSTFDICFLFFIFVKNQKGQSLFIGQIGRFDDQRLG
jgi:hypothetical protein